MPDRVRTTALSLVWTLAACHRGASTGVETPPASPGPIAEVEGGEQLLSIHVVPQLAPLELENWRFEPGGARLASMEHGDCSIWDTQTGRLIRTLEDELGPCTDWEPLVDFDQFGGAEISADDQLELDTSKGGAIVDAESGRKLRGFACPDCAEVDEVCWAPSGHQFALMWADEARVEVWDADTGKRVQAESIPIDGDLEEIALGWTAGGPTVAWSGLGSPVECDEYSDYAYDCEWDEETEMGFHRPIERELLILSQAGPEVIHAGSEGSISDLAFDGEGHWAIWTRFYSVRRAGTSTELNVEGLAGQVSDLGWTDSDDYGYGGTVERDGQWRSDGAIHWAASSSYTSYQGYASELNWETFVASPPLGDRSGLLVGELGYDSQIDVELFGLVGKTLAFAGERCDEGCVRLGPAPPPNCAFVDVGSGHGSALLDCGGTAFLRNTGGLRKLPIDAPEMQWWWSTGGALAVHDGQTFVLVDALTGAGSTPRTDVEFVYDGKLGPELDRLIVVGEFGTQVIDLRNGAVLTTLADVHPDDAALSPAGDRLALLEAGELLIVDVATGEIVVRVPSEGSDLGYRQDGAAIYVGVGEPERALDANTGQPLADPTVAKLLDALDGGGELDPSWRWIMDDEDDTLTRTIDGRSLDLAGDWLPDTGQYATTPPIAEIAFRVGEDPWAVPRFDAADLAPWLRRPKLLEEFLGGQVIPAPQIQASEFARLDAQAKTKANPKKD